MSVTIEEFELYNDVKVIAARVGLTLEIDKGLRSFTLNPPSAKGLVVYRELRDMKIFLHGYEMGANL